MDLTAWLRTLGLERYAQAFRDNDIDAELLPKLTAEDLRDLGVTSIGHRRRLLAAIAALAPDAPPAASAAGSRDMTDAPPSPAMAASGGERRQVAVLFADLAGSTELSRRLDAEEVHALLGGFFDLADRAVEEHGGTIDKHIGDCVMAVFGAPVAHGNDAERAVRAALAIREAMPALAQRAGRTVGVHIGVASGEVVATGTGSASHRAYTVTGDSVNLASRLTDQAESGEILISAAVQRALTERLDCAEVGALAVKGFAEPVRAWRLVGLRPAAVTARRPFVGRRGELHQFRGVLTACLEAGRGQAVHVRGEAGIGKTRLVEEFQREAAAAGFACHSGLVLDFGAGTGRDAIRSVLRSLLGAEAGRGEEAIAAAAGAGWVAADRAVYLYDLLDLPQPRELRPLYDAMDNAARNLGKRETVVQLVERMSRERPLLLVVEDLHWADGLTLRHLARLTEAVADCPALLVMTSRIEGDPLDREWRSRTGNSPLLTIDLGPLRRDEALALAGTFLDAGQRFAERCVERAAGNPLFLEQLLRHAEEKAEAGVPDSVQSLVQARMDRLDPADKQALQAASVFGQRFSAAGLRQLLENPAYDCGRLVAHFLVRPQGEEFLFAHALIRDAVYATLLRSRRRELHRRAADWFAARDPALQAEHLDRAEDAGAPRAYLVAARAQAAEYRYERARQLVDRGLELAADPADLFALTCYKGDILHDLGAVREARPVYEAALAAAPDDAGRCRAWLGLAAAKRITDDLDGALADLDRAGAVAARLGLTAEAAQVHFLRGNLLFPRGDIEGCLQEHRRSLDLARRAGSAELEAAALGGLGDAEYIRGRMISAHERFRACAALAHRHGFGRIEVANLPMAAITRFYTNDLADTLDDALAAVAAAARVGHQRAEIIAHHAAYLCLYAMADCAAAAAHVDASLDLSRRLGAKRFESETLALRAELRRTAGRREEAVADLEEALAISRATGMSYIGPWILAILAISTDDPGTRASALAEAETLLTAGCASHNYFWFYRDAIEICLEIGDWGSAERYAAALEDYTRPEPLPWSDLIIARARALAAFGRGRRDAALIDQLGRLRAEAGRIGLAIALPALDDALRGAGPRPSGGRLWSRVR